ncbi:hypothetical protein LEP1GSC050_1772 [Leptospira broomii serovar Hurstbridge str. 5399]|uniref:Uncharacterized protein n=1 Tax=Leptospira broomii serovar Hurstbridge str. 5399 TaxID=1049789 RepID=T0GDY4_9LEPT|nr:hypothetical protein [Leptospira broomii]EQA43593.1 hypothetical protein LEP1GSC050_1772 [Leptospira broomii serovar Hurstbridge str. 5399]
MGIRNFNFILLLLLFLFSNGISGKEINGKNWTTHPDIKEIRSIYDRIEKEIKNKELASSKKEFEYSKPYKPTLKIAFFNKKHIICKYVEEMGSDDSAIKIEYYYDDLKALRFVFITGGSVNGSRLEHRLYFDSLGKKIWEIRKIVKGPGYTFPIEWPTEEFIWNPEKEFNG